MRIGAPTHWLLRLFFNFDDPPSQAEGDSQTNVNFAIRIFQGVPCCSMHRDDELQCPSLNPLDSDGAL